MNPGEFPVDNQIAQLGGQIEELRLQALSVIAESSDAAALKETRVRFLGKTGSVSLLSEGMRGLSKEDRPVMGKLLNEIRAAVSAALEEKESALTAQADAIALSSIDASLPGTTPEAGSLHPLTLLIDRAVGLASPSPTAPTSRPSGTASMH